MGKYFVEMFGFSLALTMAVELAVAILFRRRWIGRSAVGGVEAGRSAVGGAEAGRSVMGNAAVGKCAMGSKAAIKGRLPEEALFAHPGRLLALVVLVNLLTNPAAVLLCWLGKVYLPQVLTWSVQLAVEAGVVAVEAYVYRCFAGKSGWRIGRPVALAVTANLCSWMLGVLAAAVRSQSWFRLLLLWLESQFL